MSIPLRQGPLFPSTGRLPKKFNQHLATLKFVFDLSPLFIAHMYQHKESADYTKPATMVTGIKARLNRLTFDVHQRKEEKVIILKELHTKRRAMHMALNKARIDFENADVRALAAKAEECSAAEMHQLARNEMQQEDSESWGLGSIELVNDDDLDWIDQDDYVEVDVHLSQADPSGRIWPLAYGSRFTYYRSTDEVIETSMEVSGASHAMSYQFGSEDSHHCLMNSLEGIGFVVRR